MGTSPGRIAKQCRGGAMKIPGREWCDLNQRVCCRREK